MPCHDLSEKKRRELFPGFHGHFYHSANMTFINWEIEQGALLPEHSHPHEQIVNMISGQFELFINGEFHLLEDRSVAIIPSNATHSGKAVTNCKILDVFYPIREDYQFAPLSQDAEM